MPWNWETVIDDDNVDNIFNLKMSRGMIVTVTDPKLAWLYKHIKSKRDGGDATQKKKYSFLGQLNHHQATLP